MVELKSLAKDTAIYGASSIIGKSPNYLLVPIYIFPLPAASGGYGVTIKMYAIAALLLVMLTLGMETGFFCFVNKGDDDPKKVYSVSLLMVGSVSLLFLLLRLALLSPIVGLMGYSEHLWYLGMMLIVPVMDAIQVTSSTRPCYEKRPIKLTGLKLLFVLVSILLNILYFVVVKGDDVGVAFPINLICSFAVMLGLIPKFREFRYYPDRLLMKRMLYYSFPISILGVADIVNQVGDKIIFPLVCPDKAEVDVQLGIYSAATKIVMIMAMIMQALRFVYKPFVFGKSKDKDNKQIYAQAMKPFIVFMPLAFLAVMFYLDILRYIIAENYWEGLKVVPIVMIAEMFMGIYFNFSLWYKPTNDTRWGVYFSIIARLTVVPMNIFPTSAYGHIACARAGFTGYVIAMLLSYFVGQKKYPIAYDLRGVGCYVGLTTILYLIGEWTPIHNTVLFLVFRIVLLLLFIVYIIKRDLPLSQISVINRITKKK